MSLLPNDLWVLISYDCPEVCRVFRELNTTFNRLTRGVFEKDVLSSDVTVNEVLSCSTEGFSILTEEDGRVTQYHYEIEWDEHGAKGCYLYSVKKSQGNRYLESSSNVRCGRQYDSTLKDLPVPQGMFDLGSMYLVYKKRCEMIGKVGLHSEIIRKWWSEQAQVDVEQVPSLTDQEKGSTWLALGVHLFHLFENNLVPKLGKYRYVVRERLRTPAHYHGSGGGVTTVLSRCPQYIIDQYKGIELILSLL